MSARTWIAARAAMHREVGLAADEALDIATAEAATRDEPHMARVAEDVQERIEA